MFTKMEIFMKEILKIIKNTELEDLYTEKKRKMDLQSQKANIKVNKLEINIQDNGNTVENMGKDLSHTQTKMFIKDNGKLVKNTEKVLTFMLILE